MALTLRLVFRVPLRQAEGFLRSVLSLMGVDLEAPDHTTLSRRSQSLAVAFRRIPSRGPIHRIVDSTGRSIVGEGEWAAVQHGGRGHRGWKTLHLAVDRGGVIVAHALTERHWCADAGRPPRFKPSSPSPTDAVRDGSAKLGHPVQNVTREHGLTPLPR